MKILIVTPSYFPIVGGSETLTYDLSTKLNEAGIQTDVMTLNMNEKWKPICKEKIEENGNFRVFKEPAFNPLPALPNPLSNLLGINVVPLPSFIRRLGNYDVVHFLGEADFSFPFLLFFAKKPKIMQCVGIYRKGGIYKYYASERPYLGAIWKRFFSNLAGMYIVSSDEEERLLLDLGVPTRKVRVLHIGVDTDLFRPDKTKKIDNLILFVGRIERIKGLDILLDSLSHLRVPVQLCIIGPKWDKNYAEEIEKMSDEINEKRVHSIRLLGPMNQRDLVSWYQKASVLVCPYEYETYSNVLREALACGTPVVSTGTHITENCVDGILISPKDPKKLANVLEKLLENGELREKCGLEGRRAIEESYTWGSIVKRLSNLYDEVLKS